MCGNGSPSAKVVRYRAKLQMSNHVQRSVDGSLVRREVKADIRLLILLSY